MISVTVCVSMFDMRLRFSVFLSLLLVVVISTSSVRLLLICSILLLVTLTYIRFDFIIV